MDGNSYQESLDSVLSHCGPLRTEIVPFREAAGRVLASDLQAARDDPPEAKSSMDGFALRAEETSLATDDSPVRFTFTEVVGAGHAARGSVMPGQAIRIMTGATLPEGADAVVKQEDTHDRVDVVDDQNTGATTAGRFAVHDPLRHGENIVAVGQRFARGDLLLHAGDVLTPQALGMMAGSGKSEVSVFRRPRVALLALGDELVEPGSALGPGQIYVSNLYALEAEVGRYGGEPVMLGIAGDDPGRIEALLAPRLRRKGSGEATGAPGDACDILITLGGSHRGDFDFVDEVQQRLGAKLRFRRTLINLGGSTLFATHERSVLFGLPGTPLAAWAAFELLVRPALWKMAGRGELEHPQIQARLSLPIARRPGRSHFLPAQLRFVPGAPPEVTPLDERPTAERPSALLANGLIHYPDGVESLAAGDWATVSMLGSGS